MAENKQAEMQRYSVISEKFPREILLLRGLGCTWRRCRFCDYHLDFNKNKDENNLLNAIELAKVTGIYGRMEIINSGSFVELPKRTHEIIKEVCVDKNIKELIFECHYSHREQVASLREYYGEIGVEVFVKIGVETFDSLFRECYLDKGITTDSPAEIASYFDQCCLLQGLPGQNAASMIADIETGLAHFKRVCVNIMAENKAVIKPDPRVIEEFMAEVYDKYIENPRVDILLANTEFGVGGHCTDE